MIIAYYDLVAGENALYQDFGLSTSKLSAERFHVADDIVFVTPDTRWGCRERRQFVTLFSRALHERFDETIALAISGPASKCARSIQDAARPLGIPSVEVIEQGSRASNADHIIMNNSWERRHKLQAIIDGLPAKTVRGSRPTTLAALDTSYSIAANMIRLSDVRPLPPTSLKASELQTA